MLSFNCILLLFQHLSQCPFTPGFFQLGVHLGRTALAHSAGCPYMDVTSLLLLSDNYCNNIALSQSATDTPQTDTPRNSERGQVLRNFRPQHNRHVSYCYIIG